MSSNKKEIDYFYVILSKWKYIFLVSFVFAVIAVGAVLLTPRAKEVKSSFAIDLPSQIGTAYGTYYFKTTNPKDYLNKLEGFIFNKKIAESLGLDESVDFKLTVNYEALNNATNPEINVIPRTFDLVATSHDLELEELIKVNRKAIDLFIEETDQAILDDMVGQFRSVMEIDISNMRFKTETKQAFIESLQLKLDEVKGTGVTGSNNIRKMADSYLLSGIEDDNKGILISMLLNEDKGSEYYYSSLISMEKVGLKQLSNGLNERLRLREKLDRNVVDGNYSEMFDKPFSKHLLRLTEAQVPPEESRGGVKIVLLAIFFGVILSSTVVLVKAYYRKQ